MAIINCPECQTEISDKAENCPKCGFPISSKPQQLIIKKKEGCFLQTLNLGCLIILIVIGLFVASIFFSSLGNSFNNLKNNNETKDSIHNNAKGGSR